MRALPNIHSTSPPRARQESTYVPASVTIARSLRASVPTNKVRVLCPLPSCLRLAFRLSHIVSRRRVRSLSLALKTSSLRCHAVSRQASPVRSIANMHRTSQCAVATNAIFRRSLRPSRIRSQYARILSLRRIPCHAASVRYFLAVAGPCLVMCPGRRFAPALPSCGTKLGRANPRLREGRPRGIGISL